MIIVSRTKDLDYKCQGNYDELKLDTPSLLAPAS